MFWSSARALRFMKASIAVILALTTSLFGQSPPQKHPFTFEDMMKLKRVGAPVPSPDGKWVLFDAEDVDLEANTRISHLWIVPATGGESRRLNPTSNHEERPRFSPDGKRLIWTSKATDPTQIWMCDFDTSAGALVGQPHQVTNISTGADGGIWSPDGKNILFVSAVYPDCKDDACNKERDEELKKSKVKAKIFTRLFYRHWNAFTEFKRSHLFVVSADASVGRDSVEPNDAEKFSGSAERRPTKRSHAGRSRCPAVPSRRAGHVCDFARRPGAGLHQQHRRSRSNQHEQRNFHRADGRRQPPVRLGPEENFHQSRQRFDASLFAGRKISSPGVRKPAPASKPISNR